MSDIFAYTNKNGIMNINNEIEPSVTNPLVKALNEAEIQQGVYTGHAYASGTVGYADNTTDPIQNDYQTNLAMSEKQIREYFESIGDAGNITVPKPPVELEASEETNSPKWELTGGPTTYWYRLTLNETQAKQFVKEMRGISDVLTFASNGLGFGGLGSLLGKGTAPFSIPFSYSSWMLSMKSQDYSKLATDIENELGKKRSKNIVLIMMPDTGYVQVVEYE